MKNVSLCKGHLLAILCTIRQKMDTLFIYTIIRRGKLHGWHLSIMMLVHHGPVVTGSTYYMNALLVVLHHPH